MSLRSKFEALVRDLDQENLEELRRSLASEIEARERKTAIRIEDIRPEMSAADKEQAAREIARLLRGQE
jgi:hypothetical protein